MKQSETKLIIIQNYIDYFTSNNDERKLMYENVYQYVKEDHVDELEESTELEEAKKYDLGFGSKGSGTTVWNRAEQDHRDYKTVAHISVFGNITYYDKKMPEDVKRQIEDMAKNDRLETF